MLNELAQIAEALRRAGVNVEARHRSIQPLGKNKPTLVISLGADGAPLNARWIDAETSATLFKVNHESAGTSFPGFNLELPAGVLPLHEVGNSSDQTTILIRQLGAKKLDMAAIRMTIGQLRPHFIPRTPTPAESRQFDRSTHEHVVNLRTTFADTSADAASFTALLDLLCSHPPQLSEFLSKLSTCLFTSCESVESDELRLNVAALFGVLDWKKRSCAPGTTAYVAAKAEQDAAANKGGKKLSVYLDLADLAEGLRPVAHASTGRAINAHLMHAGAAATVATSGDASSSQRDAFGLTGLLADTHPEPKVAQLGNLRLFALNTKEIPALFRYGLGGSDTFPVNADLVQRMSDALLYLASDERRHISCHPIPSAQSDKSDLLVVYLEEAPALDVPLADLFGAETPEFSDRDFRELAAPVRAWLHGESRPPANARLGLFALSAVDKAKKQVSLSRSFTIDDLQRAADRWESSAANVPFVAIWFRDKMNKENVFRTGMVPTPLDLVSALNRVWVTDTKLGYAFTFARIFSVGEGFDLFVGQGDARVTLARRGLAILLARSTTVLGALAQARTKHRWTDLSDTVRQHCSRSVGLLGIFLHALNQLKTDYMKEPTYHLGRLLSVADQLHLQYCQHVRDGSTPSQLIGNALFATALEQPVFALARLAERIMPYQAWARTFHNTDPAVKSGWEKVLLRQFEEHANAFLERLADGSISIRADELPARMTDLEKAKLLLGYLADPSRETISAPPAQEPVTAS